MAAPKLARADIPINLPRLFLTDVFVAYRQSWAGRIASVFLHLGLLFFFILPSIPERTGRITKLPAEPVVTVFIPQRGQKLPKKPLIVPAERRANRIEIGSEPKLKAGGIQIIFRRDVDGQQLPRVLQSMSGYLGFGYPKDKRYFQYLVRASDWQRIESDHAVFALEGYFVLKFDPPDDWRFLDSIRTQNRIPSGLTAYALFPPEMESEIFQAVEKALKGTGMEPKAIEVSFARSELRGFTVRILEAKKK